MTILNITYNGLSADYALDGDTPMTDGDVRRVAVEVVRSGAIRGLGAVQVGDRAFDDFVVDRFETPRHLGGGRRIYLRPKVPFG